MPCETCRKCQTRKDFSPLKAPIPPIALSSDQIGIEVGPTNYGEGFSTQLISFGAPKDTYRALALLTLSVVFHREPEMVEIHLTHPESKVSWLQISSTFPDPDAQRDTGVIRASSATRRNFIRSNST